MGCKRFEDELKDAALGGLPPERETELRAHLRECAACRGEFERQQRLVAAMDRSLEHLASVEPSPEMVARIRLKIAEQPEPRRGWLPAWWPAAAGALAAAAFVAYLMVPGEMVQPPVENPPVVATTTEPKPAEPVVKAVPSVAVKPPRKPVRPAPIEVADSRPSLPEVLVPRDQERALAWLYRTMQRQPQRMNAVLAQEAQNLEEKGRPLQIARLSISPLAIGGLEFASPDTEIRQ